MSASGPMSALCLLLLASEIKQTFLPPTWPVYWCLSSKQPEPTFSNTIRVPLRARAGREGFFEKVILGLGSERLTGRIGEAGEEKHF